MKTLRKHNSKTRALAAMLSVMVAFAVLAAPTQTLRAAAPNDVISYQGRLLNSNGTPVSDASLEFVFRLFTAVSGGACLWESDDGATCDATDETQTVALTDGLFSENIGSIDDPAGASEAYPVTVAGIFEDNSDVFLEVQVGGETLTPRKRIAAAPYALNSQTLDGFDSGDFLAATGDTASGIFNFTGAVFSDGSPLVFEGATANDFEATLAFTDPTADRVVTFQNASGTVAFLADIGTSSQWETGASAIYEDDDDVAIGTSGDETIAASGFSLSGNDFFVAGDIGVEGSLYSDATLNVVGTVLDVDSLDFAGAGTVTTTGAGTDLTLSPTDQIILNGGSTVDVQDSMLSSVGDLTIADALVPDADNSRALGSASLGWSALFLRNTDDGATISLSADGTTEATSGASVIGVFDEFSNSGSNNVQDVLDDLDAAISSGGTTQWENGASAIYEDDDDVAIGTSGDETIAASGFSLGGNDFFVAGDIGVEGSLYSDATLNVVGTVLDVDSLDFAGAGTVTTTGAGTDLTLSPVDQIVLNGGSTVDVQDSILNSAGSVTISDDMVPEADGTRSFGSSLLGWATIFLRNTDDGVTVSLSSDGTGETNSGASAVGVFDEFGNSAGGNVQDALDDLDAAISSGGAGSMWTLAGGVLYPTDATNDFAVGGTAAAASPFGVDESANTVFIGEGSGGNGTLTFKASDADTGSLAYTTNDRFSFTGGDITLGSDTISGVNAAFAADGDDFFTTGHIAAQDSMYADAFVAGDASTTFADGSVTTTGTTDLTLTVGGGDIVVGTNDIEGTAASITFSEFSVAAGTGSIVVNDGGDAGSLTVEGTVLDVNSLDFVGAAAFTSAAAMAFGDGGDAISIDSSDWDISATGAITGASFDANGTGNSLSNVETGDIAADTILAGNIAAGAVATSEILDATILTGDISTGGVTSANILDGTIADADTNGALTGAALAADTLVAGDIAAGAVATSEILDGTILNADLAGGSYTGITTVGTLASLTLGGALDMGNNLITNVGNAGTDFTSAGGLTLAGTFTANGTSAFNADADFLLDGTENVVIGNATGTGSNGVDLLSINIINTDAAANTQRGINVVNAAGSSSATDALIALDNADAIAVTSGIILTGSGGAITTAINASDANIGSALLIGDNEIGGTSGATVNFGNFDVLATGEIQVAAGTGLDTNAAGTLDLARVNATVFSACNSSACDSIQLGTNADADVITIGDSNDAIGLNAGSGDITLTSSDDFLFVGSAGSEVDITAAASTVTAGVIDLNVDSSVTGGFEAAEFSLTMNDGAADGDNFAGLSVELTGNDASGDLFGIALAANATANAAAGTYENFIVMNNAENTVGAVTDAIKVSSTSGTDGDITTGLNVSDANITNAINVGANVVAGTTASIEFTDFGVNSDGKITLTPDLLGDAINIVLPAADTQGLVIDGSTNDNASTDGIIEVNGTSTTDTFKVANFTLKDVDDAGADTMFGLRVSVDNDATTVDDTVYGVVISNVNSGDVDADKVSDAFLYMEHLDTGEAMPDGILFSSAAGGITDAIDASDSDIVNAINVGANVVLGTSASINFTEFDLSATGDIVSTGGAEFGDASGTDLFKFTTAAATSDALQIIADSVTTADVWEMSAAGLTTGRGAFLERENNGTSFTSTAGLLTVSMLDTTSSGDAANFINSGTGSAVFVDQNGNTGTTIDTTTGGAVHIDNTGNANFGLTVYTNQSASSSNLASFFNDNAAFDDYVVEIRSDATDAGSSNGTALRIFQNEVDTTVGNSVGTHALVIDTNTDCGAGDGVQDDGAIIKVREDLGGASGGPDTVFRLECDGDLFADGTLGTAAADVAETYASTDALAPGDLVAFDPGGSGVLRSSSAYQSTLVGAVSTVPGVLLGSEDPGYRIALVGRIPAFVDDSNGPIAAGDPITSSVTAGVGMKSTEPGMIVGFALEDFAGPGQGTVSLFVSPQFYMGAVVGTDGMMTRIEDDVELTGSLALRGSGGSAAERMTLVTDVTDATDYRLSIENSAGTSVAYVSNAGDLALAGRLYPSDRGAIQTSKYIYYDGASGMGGDFMRTNASGWATGSYDFAEMFPSRDTLEPGDIVVFGTDDESVARSRGAADPGLAGIVSTRPGFLAGDNEAGHYPVALAGRVPTKVSAENGDIAIGDPLTSSSTEGYAMKATESGPVVGYALEPFDGSADDDKIVAFVNVSYWNGGATPELPGTNNQASTIVVTQSASNLTALNMSGNIYLSGNEILGVGRIAGLSSAWSIDGEGTIVAEGVVKTSIESYQGERVETAAVTSPDVLITLFGTATLANGEAVVRFEDASPEFNDVTSTVAPIRVLVTPNGPVSLYVYEKNNDGFGVRQVDGAGDGVTFDWMVSAYRKDYEPEEELEIEEEEPVETVETEEIVVEEVPDEVAEEPADPVSPDISPSDSMESTFVEEPAP